MPPSGEIAERTVGVSRSLTSLSTWRFFVPLVQIVRASNTVESTTGALWMLFFVTVQWFLTGRAGRGRPFPSHQRPGRNESLPIYRERASERTDCNYRAYSDQRILREYFLLTVVDMKLFRPRPATARRCIVAIALPPALSSVYSYSEPSLNCTSMVPSLS